MPEEQLELGLEPAPQKVVWTAVYWRFYDLHEEELVSARDAWGYLYYGEEEGHLSPSHIVRSDGTEISYNKKLANGLTTFDESWDSWETFYAKHIKE